MKKFFFVLLISFFFFPILLIYPIAEKEEIIKILYTSSLNGNLDGCECKGSPRAGLVKRASYFRSLTDRGNIILVDVGDILSARPDELLASEILETYREIGYDVIGVGDQEFSNGIEKLLKYREYNLLVSNNLAVCPDENICIFFSLRPVVIEKGSITIGIFSLIDPEVFTLYPDEFKSHIQISSEEATAENILYILEQEGVDLKILLYHGLYENALTLTESVNGIDVIIVGHEQMLLDAIKVGDSIIVSPGEEGNRIGILSLSYSQNEIIDYNNSFKIFHYEEDPDDPSVRERITRYQNIRSAQ